MEVHMRRSVPVVPLTAVVLLAAFAFAAFAQETKTARGTVTAMTGDVITVKAGDREMKFTTDAKTTVVAEGAGTAAREAQAAGQKGATLSELIKVGTPVEISYTETGGTMRASRIRRVRDAGAGGGSTSEQRSETATGVIESLSGNTITLSGSTGGGGTFKQSFTVDSTTDLIGEGAGTASAKAGGKLNLMTFLTAGDRVSITYNKVKDTLQATSIRVIQKAKK
jgi:hypothetical protein